MSTHEHELDSLLLRELKLDSKPGPALMLSAEAQQALVAATLRQALSAGLLESTPTLNSAERATATLETPSTPVNIRRRSKLSLVVVGVFVATAAAAAVKVIAAYSSKVQPAPTVAASLTHYSPAPNPGAAGVTPSSENQTAPAVEAAPRSDLAASPSLSRTPASQAEPVTQRRARDLLEQANRLRRKRQFREAVAVYLEVERGYPGSLQAQAARVAAAELQLTQLNDAASAQKLYAQALRSGGPLSPEAAFGLAEVYRRQGETDKARDAWREFIRRYPDSPLVEIAQRRLKEFTQ